MSVLEELDKLLTSAIKGDGVLASDDGWDASAKDLRRKVRAAIRDSVLVPREPTEAMVEAGCAVTCKECHGDCRYGPTAAIYRAMLERPHD